MELTLLCPSVGPVCALVCLLGGNNLPVNPKCLLNLWGNNGELCTPQTVASSPQKKKHSDDCVDLRANNMGQEQSEAKVVILPQVPNHCVLIAQVFKHNLVVSSQETHIMEQRFKKILHFFMRFENGVQIRSTAMLSTKGCVGKHGLSGTFAQEPIIPFSKCISFKFLKFSLIYGTEYDQTIISCEMFMRFNGHEFRKLCGCTLKMYEYTREIDLDYMERYRLDSLYIQLEMISFDSLEMFTQFAERLGVGSVLLKNLDYCKQNVVSLKDNCSVRLNDSQLELLGVGTTQINQFTFHLDSHILMIDQNIVKHLTLSSSSISGYLDYSETQITVDMKRRMLSFKQNSMDMLMLERIVRQFQLETVLMRQLDRLPKQFFIGTKWKVTCTGICFSKLSGTGLSLTPSHNAEIRLFCPGSTFPFYLVDMSVNNCTILVRNGSLDLFEFSTKFVHFFLEQQNQKTTTLTAMGSQKNVPLATFLEDLQLYAASDLPNVSVMYSRGMLELHEMQQMTLHGNLSDKSKFELHVSFARQHGVLKLSNKCFFLSYKLSDTYRKRIRWERTQSFCDVQIQFHQN